MPNLDIRPQFDLEQQTNPYPDAYPAQSRSNPQACCALHRYVQASKEAWFARPAPRVASQVVWDGYKYAEELGCALDNPGPHVILQCAADGNSLECRSRFEP